MELGKLLKLKEGRHLGAGGRGNKRLSISTKVWCEKYPEIADKCFFVIGITAGLRTDFPVTEAYKAHKFPERLMARPIATLSIEAQERHERDEKIFVDD